MKILLTAHAFLPKSLAGTETYTHDLAKALQKLGQQVSVLYPDSIIAGDSAKVTCINDSFDEIPVHILSYNILYMENYVEAEYYNKEVEKFLLEFLKELRPDIVHSIHCGHLSTAVITACKKLRIPILYMATDFWLICPTSQLLRYDLSLCKGPFNIYNCLLCYYFSRNPHLEKYIDRFKKMPRILSNAMAFIFNEDLQKFSNCLNIAKRLVLRLKKLGINLNAMFQYFYPPGKVEEFLEDLFKTKAIEAISKRRKWMKQIISSLDLFIAPSRFLLNMFIKNGLDPKKALYLPYGRDLKWTESSGPREKKDLFHFGYVGLIAPWKGVDLLIKAFNHMCQGKKVYLKIYGDLNFLPDYTEKLMKLSQGNERISFQGAFPKHKIVEAMKSIDVLIVPSIWYENTPFVIQEAMAAKIPVIATNLRGMSEIVKHKFNGLLFKKGDYKDLANQMVRIAGNSTLLEKYKNKITLGVTIEENSAELVRIYSSLLQREN